MRKSMKKNILVKTIWGEAAIFFVVYSCITLCFEGLSIKTIAQSFIASIIYLLLKYALNRVSKKKSQTT